MEIQTREKNPTPMLSLKPSRNPGCWFPSGSKQLEDESRSWKQKCASPLRRDDTVSPCREFVLFISDQEGTPVLLVSSHIRCLLSVCLNTGWDSFNKQVAKCCHCFWLHTKRCLLDDQLEKDAWLEHMEASGSTQLGSAHAVWTS